MTQLTNEEALKVLEALNIACRTPQTGSSIYLGYATAFSIMEKAIKRPATPAPAGWVMKPAEKFVDLLATTYRLRAVEIAREKEAEYLSKNLLFSAEYLERYQSEKDPEILAAIERMRDASTIIGAYTSQSVAAPAVSNPDGWKDILFDAYKAVSVLATMCRKEKLAGGFEAEQQIMQRMTDIAPELSGRLAMRSTAPAETVEEK